MTKEEDYFTLLISEPIRREYDTVAGWLIPDTRRNWSAEAENSERCLWVSGVGMTMSEFIDLFRKNQIYYTVGTNSSFQQITAYKKVPNWETEGYVKAIDKNNNTLILYISDCHRFCSVNITKETPSWLLEDTGDKIVTFQFKIFQGWLRLKLLDNLDWSDVWKTFEFDGLLDKEEIELYY